MKMPEGKHRWLPAAELARLAGGAGFGLAEISGRILCPKEIPFLAGSLNCLAKRVSFLRPACLIQVLVFTLADLTRIPFRQSRPRRERHGHQQRVERAK